MALIELLTKIEAELSELRKKAKALPEADSSLVHPRGKSNNEGTEGLFIECKQREDYNLYVAIMEFSSTDPAEVKYIEDKVVAESWTCKKPTKVEDLLGIKGEVAYLSKDEFVMVFRNEDGRARATFMYSPNKPLTNTVYLDTIETMRDRLMPYLKPLEERVSAPAQAATADEYEVEPEELPTSLSQEGFELNKNYFITVGGHLCHLNAREYGDKIRIRASVKGLGDFDAAKACAERFPEEYRANPMTDGSMAVTIKVDKGEDPVKSAYDRALTLIINIALSMQKPSS